MMRFFVEMLPSFKTFKIHSAESQETRFIFAFLPYRKHLWKAQKTPLSIVEGIIGNEVLLLI